MAFHRQQAPTDTSHVQAPGMNHESLAKPVGLIRPAMFNVISPFQSNLAWLCGLTQAVDSHRHKSHAGVFLLQSPLGSSTQPCSMLITKLSYAAVAAVNLPPPPRCPICASSAVGTASSPSNISCRWHVPCSSCICVNRECSQCQRFPPSGQRHTRVSPLGPFARWGRRQHQQEASSTTK